MYKKKMSVKFIALVAVVCLIATIAPAYALAPKSPFEQEIQLLVTIGDGLKEYGKIGIGKFPDGELKAYTLNPKAFEGRICAIEASTNTDEDIVKLILSVALLRDSNAKRIRVFLPESSVSKANLILDALSPFCDIYIVSLSQPYVGTPHPDKPNYLGNESPDLVLVATQEIKEKLTSNNIPPVEIVNVNTMEDGGIRVSLPQDVRGKKVQFMHSTRRSRDIVELIATLEHLRQNGATEVSCFFPYFGYARQHNNRADKKDEMPEGSINANSSKILLELINRYCGYIYTINVHFFENGGVQAFPQVEGLRIINLNAFSAIAKYFQRKYADLKRPILVGADKGVLEYVRSAAEALGLEWGYLKKERQTSEEVLTAPHVFDAKGNKINIEGRDVILLDDEISTGDTIVKASRRLREQHSSRVFVGCMIGKFSRGLDIFEGLVDDVVSTDAVAGPKSEASLSEFIISNLQRPNNLYEDLLKNNPEGISIMKKRLKFLLGETGLIELLRKRIGEDDGLKNIDMDKTTIVLYGDFLWHSEKDAPNDIDILVITQAPKVRYRRVWTLSNRIPRCEVIIRGIDDPEMRKNLPLAMLGWGRLIYGNNDLIENLKIPLTDVDILSWSNRLKEKGWQNLSLGNELGDYGRCWKRLFEAYLYLRLLLQKYAPDEIDGFEREVFDGPLSDFYHLFYTGKIEKLPWRSEDASTKLWRFYTNLDSLTKDLESLLSSAHEDELRRAP